MTKSPERPPLLKVTESAIRQVKNLLEKRGKPSVGIRLGVKTRGCSGYQYTLEYADEIGGLDEVIEVEGITILIDPKSVMFFIGCEMDYIEDKLNSGFTFTNPNEKGRCGCGESFHV